MAKTKKTPTRKNVKSAKKAKVRLKAKKAVFKIKGKAKGKKGKEPQPPKPHKKKHPGELKLKKADPEAMRRKLYAEQEKLWMSKLNAILADAYIRQMLIDLAGENTLEIVRNFNGEVSDEELAKRLKLKISDVRATLNKLHNESLVQYIRQKDNETGWYSYSWLLNKGRIATWAQNHSEKRNSFDAEGNDRYFCPGCGLESMLEFEKATEIQFRCQKCNKGLEFLDREKFEELVKA